MRLIDILIYELKEKEKFSIKWNQGDDRWRNSICITFTFLKKSYWICMFLGI